MSKREKWMQEIWFYQFCVKDIQKAIQLLLAGY